MNFEPLKKVFERVAAGRNLAGSFSAAEAVELAQKLFAAELPQISTDFRVQKIQNGVLSIATRTPAISHELRLAETTVLDSLKKRFPKIERTRYFVARDFDDFRTF